MKAKFNQEVLIKISFFIFLVFWSIRLYKLIEIIFKIGILPDFYGYYRVIHNLFSVSPDLSYIVHNSFGPPFVLLPFLPFTIFSLKIAEVLITFVNLASFFIVFYLLWKHFLKKITPLFWILLSLISFSFPLTYSLGGGNPMGLVTLGIYSLWIFKNKYLRQFFFTVSVLLKIYPAVVIPGLLFGKTKLKDILMPLASLVLGLVISIIILPLNIWSYYLKEIQGVTSRVSTAVDPAIVNQSFSSSFARLGIEIKFLSFGYIAFALGIFSLLLIFLYQVKKIKSNNQVEIAIALLCLLLLIFPTPWQYYFAVILPFLIIKLGQKRWIFILPLLLISFNGNLLSGGGLIKNFLDSSQFLATLIIFFLITLEPLSKIINNKA